MNYKNISFKEIYKMIKQKKLLDKDNRYIEQKPKDNKHNFEMFVENSGLTYFKALVVLEYTIENEDLDLNKKVLESSER